MKRDVNVVMSLRSEHHRFQKQSSAEGAARAAADLCSHGEITLLQIIRSVACRKAPSD